MAQAMLSLDRLPDDILYLILADLDTARDNASLSRTCRRLRRFMQSDGWRAFSLRCFQGLPSLESRAPRPTLRWDCLADSLTWQARAWDRRSLAFQALLPREVGTHHKRRQESFRPPLAVHFQADLSGALGSVDGEEMVVWGAGEDVVARYRRRGVEGTLKEEDDDDDDDDPLAVARWRVLHGKTAGFRPGYDDVRGLAVVSNAMGRLRHRGILAGRDNGHLALLSAEGGSFGQTLAQFLPEKTQGVVQDRIYSLDVASAGRAFGGLDNRSGLVAATTSSHIAFYALPGQGETETTETPLTITPTAVFDMAAHGLNHNGRRMPYNVKWMAADGLAAVGLGFRSDQLCYLTARPTGFALTATAKSRAFMQRFGLDDETLLLPSSLQPVPPTAVTGGRGSLVLAAWRDGTCRLQDVRTPSSFDLAYQDNIAPSQCFQSLLVYAPDRFLAGNQESTTLKVFDLRWPRRYYHTAGLPCGGGRPFPEPWLVKEGPAMRAPRARCDPLTGDLCTWHDQSRLLASRPNCSIYLQRSAVSRYPDIGVWSLARAAGPDGGDLIAPNFYAGLNSCIVEGILCENRDLDGRRKTRKSRRPPGDPHYSYPDVLRQRPLSLVPAPPPEQGPVAAAEWRRRQAVLQRRHHYYRTVDLQWYLHEIGDGLADPDNDKRPRRLATPLRGSRPGASRRQASQSVGGSVADVPHDASLDPHRVRPGHMPTEEADVDPILRRQHRLDSIMQRMADFTSFYEKP